MKTLRIISLIALGSLFIVLAAHPAATQAAAAGKVIRIYQSWPMQGSMIPEGTAMLNAAKMALDEVCNVNRFFAQNRPYFPDDARHIAVKRRKRVK